MAGSTSERFPCKASAVGQARRWLLDVLQGWSLPVPTTEDALLLTSELATNAVIHALSAFDVTASCDRGLLRVGVADDAHHMPIVRDDPYREGGRGLKLVQALASSWGTELLPGDGKIVWFEMPS